MNDVCQQGGLIHWFLYIAGIYKHVLYAELVACLMFAIFRSHCK